MRRYVTSCDRYRVRVTTWGEGRAPHAVVLPGLLADWRALAPQIRTLRRLGWTVHVIDLPGFAMSPALSIADARLDRLAEYVARAMRERTITSALVLGHSLGGGVALHLALEAPQLVRGLVLIAPAGLGRSLLWVYKLYCVPLLGRALLRPGLVARAPFIRRFLIGAARRQDARLVARLTRHGASASCSALSARAVVWANQPRDWRKAMALVLPGGEQLGFRIDGRLAELHDVPALVLWGDHDRVISAADAKRCRELPLAEVHIAHGVGHSLPLEAAAWANEHITRFAASLVEREARAA